MDSTQTASAAARLPHDVVQDLALEYCAAGHKYAWILSHLGISPDAFPRTLAALADDLGIADVNLESFMLALQMNDAERGLRDLATERDESWIQRMRDVRAAAEEDVARLNSGVEEQDDKTTKDKIQVLRQKAREYETKIARLSKDEPPVTFAQVQSLEREVNDLEAQVNDYKQQHESYTKLPADLKLAKVKVAEAEAELAMVLKERDQAVGKYLEE